MGQELHGILSGQILELVSPQVENCDLLLVALDYETLLVSQLFRGSQLF